MSRIKILFVFLLSSTLFPATGGAQPSLNAKLAELETRVQALEEYSEKLQKSLNSFSQKLVNTVDEQLRAAAGETAVLNPISRKVTKIETNTGTFLVSIQKTEKLSNGDGYRLYLQVGNPHGATYGDVKIRLYWGTKWDPSYQNVPYEEWRNSLTGGEYVYNGLLESGVWTDIAVDLIPAAYNQLQYVECQMEVNTVKLQKAKTF